MSKASHTGLVVGVLVIFGTPLFGGTPAAPPAVGVAQATPAPFEADVDVGDVKLPGATAFDPARGEFRITASGSNVWGVIDAFHFLSRPVSGDLDLSAAIGFVGEGRNPHRKAGLMVRASLAPDAPYVHAVVHGDGLVSLQYREVAGGETREVKASLSAVPVALHLSRRGDVFTMLAGAPGTPPQRAASIRLALPATAQVGLAACSHEADWRETAVFTEVEVAPRP